MVDNWAVSIQRPRGAITGEEGKKGRRGTAWKSDYTDLVGNHSVVLEL